VQGSGATLAALRIALRAAASRTGVQAVDLIFVTHGATSRVFFSDGDRSMFTVRDELVSNLTDAQRGRLRMVFSTACFGGTHRARWMEAGFDTASGSAGIYADSAATFVPFLGAWALGQSFGSAVDLANGVDFFRVFDNAAKEYYRSKNQADLANQVNSFRFKLGSTGLTIDGNPVGTFRLAPAHESVVLGRRVTYKFSWTVPKPRKWRRLRSIGLRLKDDQATAIALRWSQASNRFQLVDGNDRPRGASKRAGRRGSLRGPFATLSLRRTRVVGKGRTARLRLPLTFFRPLAAGRTFRVQVRADTDGGAKAPWQDAGTLSVY
jgi:hypothetical protein